MSNLDVNNSLSVQISGNPESNSGFESLWSYGRYDLVGVVDEIYPGVSRNHHFFVVKISAIGVAYRMHICNITSNGAGRNGALILGIFIPKDFQLKGGECPFVFLERLFEQFKKQALMPYPTGDGKTVYQFKERTLSDYNLEELVQIQSLERSNVKKWVVMQGQAKAYQQVSSDNLSTFDKDLRYYDRLAAYSELVIAEEIVGQPLLGLDVPRKKEYLIKVNGVEQQRVSDIDEEVTLCSSSPSRYYDADRVEFKIRDLLEGKNPSPTKIHLAEIEDEIIRVTLQVTPKKKIYQVVYKTPNNENPKVLSPRILIRNKNVVIQNNSFTLVGDEIGYISSAQVFIQQSDYDYDRYERMDNKFIIHLIPKPKCSTPSITPSGQTKQYNNTNRPLFNDSNQDQKDKNPSGNKQKINTKLLFGVAIVSLGIGFALGVVGDEIYHRHLKTNSTLINQNDSRQTVAAPPIEEPAGPSVSNDSETTPFDIPSSTSGQTETTPSSEEIAEMEFKDVSQHHFNNMKKADINLGELGGMSSWYKDLSADDLKKLSSEQKELFELYSELYTLMKDGSAEQTKFQKWVNKAKRKVNESARLKVARIYTDGNTQNGDNVKIRLQTKFQKRRDMVKSNWNRTLSFQNLNDMLQANPETKVEGYEK